MAFYHEYIALSLSLLPDNDDNEDDDDDEDKDNGDDDDDDDSKGRDDNNKDDDDDDDDDYDDDNDDEAHLQDHPVSINMSANGTYSLSQWVESVQYYSIRIVVMPFILFSKKPS